jgi:hypothetical protein
VGGTEVDEGSNDAEGPLQLTTEIIKTMESSQYLIIFDRRYG